ncbi:hypothetical protein F4782DRAFT_502945 [Xylaria castorea]|nr:hypothetical protein F4782DRAFT_502945 [Xylaria castorea]
MPKTKISTIIKRNAQFESQNRQAHQGEYDVCVFAGAMSGIGARILERMVMVSYHSTVFYVLWDSSEPSNSHRKRVLESILNRGCKIVFIDADVSLISDMDAASKQIIDVEEKVDYLCMSKNDTPVGDATNTSEGVDIAMSVWYFSRMRLLSNLIPLLRRSQKPRVLDILNHGVQGPTDKDYGGHGTILQYSNVMTNLAFNHLETENRQITFILSPMGFDKTGNSQDADASETMSVFQKAWRTVLNVRLDVSEQLFGRKPNKVLERHVYYLTSSTCGPGAFHIDTIGDIVPSTREPFCEEDKDRSDIVWQFTEQLWQQAIAQKVATQS